MKRKLMRVPVAGLAVSLAVSGALPGNMAKDLGVVSEVQAADNYRFDVTDESLDATTKIWMGDPDYSSANATKISGSSTYIKAGDTIYSDRELIFTADVGGSVSVDPAPSTDNYYAYLINYVPNGATTVSVKHVTTTESITYTTPDSNEEDGYTDDQDKLLRKDANVKGVNQTRTVATLTIPQLNDSSQVVYGIKYTPVVTDTATTEPLAATVTYEDAQGHTSNAVPKDAGEYTAIAQFEYENGTRTLKKKFKITKAPLSAVNFTETSEPFTYDGTQHEVTFTLDYGAYKWEDASESGYTLTEDDYTIDIVDDPETTDIEEAGVTQTNVSAAEKGYGIHVKAADDSNFVGEATYTWNINKAKFDFVVTSDDPNMTIPDGKTAYEGDYKGAEYTFTAATDPNKPVLDGNEVTYTKKYYKLDGTTPALVDEGRDGEVAGEMAPTKAGNYYVAIEAEVNTDNYIEYTGDNARKVYFNINRKMVYIVPTALTAITYGDELPPVTGFTAYLTETTAYEPATKDTVEVPGEYSDEAGGAIAARINDQLTTIGLAVDPAAANGAGTFDIIAGGDVANTEDVEIKLIRYQNKFTVNPKELDVDMFTVTDDATVYDGGAKKASIIAEDEDADAASLTSDDYEILYTTGTSAVYDEENKVANNDPINAGTYSIYAAIPDSGSNYTITANEGAPIKIGTLTINPKSIAGATVTIASIDDDAGKDAVEYDGNPHTAVVLVKDGETTLEEGEDKDYTVATAQLTKTDADDYDIEVTGKGNYTGTATGTAIFKITKAKNTVNAITVAGTPITYNNAAPAVTFSNDTGLSEDQKTAILAGLKYYAFDHHDDTKDENVYSTEALDAAPKDVGKYKVVATIPELTNYAETPVSAEFEITKKDVTITLVNALKLNGTTKDLDYEYGEVSANDLFSELGITYSYADEEDKTVAGVTTLGDIDKILKFAESVVNDEANKLPVNTDNIVEVNTEAEELDKNFNVTSVSNKIHVKQATWPSLTPTYDGITTYSDTAVSGNMDYDAETGKYGDFKFTGAVPAGTTFTVDYYTLADYTTNSANLSNATKLTDENLPKNAGSYKAVITPVNASYNIGSTTYAVDVVIAPQEIEITPNEITQVYGEAGKKGAELTYMKTGTVHGEDKLYTDDTGALLVVKNGDDAVADDAVLNVGNYDIALNDLTWNQNYHVTLAAGSGTNKYEVTKRSIAHEGVTYEFADADKDVKYTGTAHNINESGFVVKDTLVQYDGTQKDAAAIANTNYALSGDLSKTDVGNYEVVITGAGDNYDETTTKKAEWSIGEKAIAAKIALNSTRIEDNAGEYTAVYDAKPFTDSEFKLVYNGAGDGHSDGDALSPEETPDTITWTFEKDGTPLTGVPKDAGVYTVKATATKGNYEYNNITSLSFTITKRPVTLTPDAEKITKVYGANPEEFTQAYTLSAGDQAVITLDGTEPLKNVKLQVSPKITATTPFGEYPISLSTTSLANYTLALANPSVRYTVTKKAFNDPAVKLYFGDEPVSGTKEEPFELLLKDGEVYIFGDSAFNVKDGTTPLTEDVDYSFDGSAYAYEKTTGTATTTTLTGNGNYDDNAAMKKTFNWIAVEVKTETVENELDAIKDVTVANLAPDKVEENPELKTKVLAAVKDFGKLSDIQEAYFEDNETDESEVAAIKARLANLESALDNADAVIAVQDAIKAIYADNKTVGQIASDEDLAKIETAKNLYDDLASDDLRGLVSNRLDLAKALSVKANIEAAKDAVAALPPAGTVADTNEHNDLIEAARAAYGKTAEGDDENDAAVEIENGDNFDTLKVKGLSNAQRKALSTLGETITARETELGYVKEANAVKEQIEDLATTCSTITVEEDDEDAEKAIKAAREAYAKLMDPKNPNTRKAIVDNVTALETAEGKLANAKVAAFAAYADSMTANTTGYIDTEVKQNGDEAIPACLDLISAAKTAISGKVTAYDAAAAKEKTLAQAKAEIQKSFSTEETPEDGIIDTLAKELDAARKGNEATNVIALIKDIGNIDEMTYVEDGEGNDHYDETAVGKAEAAYEAYAAKLGDNPDEAENNLVVNGKDDSNKDHNYKKDLDAAVARYNDLKDFYEYKQARSTYVLGTKATPTYEGNANVLALIDAASGAILAKEFETDLTDPEEEKTLLQLNKDKVDAIEAALALDIANQLDADEVIHDIDTMIVNVANEDSKQSIVGARNAYEEYKAKHVVGNELDDLVAKAGKDVTLANGETTYYNDYRDTKYGAARGALSDTDGDSEGSKAIIELADTKIKNRAYDSAIESEEDKTAFEANLDEIDKLVAKFVADITDQRKKDFADYQTEMKAKADQIKAEVLADNNLNDSTPAIDAVVKGVKDAIDAVTYSLSDDDITNDDFAAQKAAVDACLKKVAAINPNTEETEDVDLETALEYLIEAAEADQEEAADFLAKVPDLSEVVYTGEVDEEGNPTDSGKDIADAKADYAELSPAVKEIVDADGKLKNADDLYNGLVAKATAAATDVKKAIDAIGTDKVGATNYTDKKTVIETAEEAYANAELTAAQKTNLVDKAAATYAEEETTYKAKLENARSDYDAAVKKAADQEKANDVADIIKEIPTPVEYTEPCDEKITAAEEALAKLSDDQKELLPGTANEDTVTAARDAYNKAKKAAEDQEKADGVAEVIGEIPDEIAYTDDCEASIKAAEEALKTLNDDQKKLLPDEANASVVTEARDAFEDAKEAAESKAAAADAAITDIGEVVYTGEVDEDNKPTDSGKDITAARSAYDGVPAKAQSLVTNYSDLVAAEKLYQNLKSTAGAAAGEAKTAIDAIGIDKVDATNYTGKKELIETAEAAYATATARLTEAQKTNLLDNVATTYGEGTTTYKGKLEAARTDYDAAKKNADDASAAAAVENAIKAIGEVTEENYEEKLPLIEAAEKALATLDEAQKELLPGTANEDTVTAARTAYGTAKKSAEDKAAAKEAEDAIKAIVTPVAYTDKCEASIKAAEEALKTLDATQKALLPENANEATVTAARAAYDAAEDKAKAAAKAVDDAIADIGKVANTDECKAKIDNARELYDKLPTDKAKALVQNLAALEKAEAGYEALKGAADDTAADAVAEAIEALPASEAVTTDNEEAIEAARDAYDKLTDDQKKLINDETLKKLTDAEDALDEAKADEVEEAIKALPAKADVKASDEAAIKAAKDAYDKLTDDQKKLVDPADVTKLEEAEDALDEAKAAEAEALMNELPASADVKASDEAAIKAARDAYDKLTDDQKKLVDPAALAKLTAAEEALPAAKEADAADQEAADEVAAAIDALPASSAVKASDEAAIKAAREAYEALTPAQQAKVPADKLSKLAADEEAVEVAKTAASKEALKAKIDEATAYAASIKDSDPETAAALEDAVKAANTVYNNSTATKAAMTNAADTLVKALNSAKAKPVYEDILDVVRGLDSFEATGDILSKDVNGDGKVTATDAAYLFKMYNQGK